MCIKLQYKSHLLYVFDQTEFGGAETLGRDLKLHRLPLKTEPAGAGQPGSDEVTSARERSGHVSWLRQLGEGQITSAGGRSGHVSSGQGLTCQVSLPGNICRPPSCRRLRRY